MTQTRRLRRLPLLLALAATLGAGAACSGSGPGGDGVASIKTASGDKAAAGSGDDKEPSPKDREEALLDFARCMREHGIDMPDPDTSGGGGMVKFGVASAGAGKKIEGGMEKFEEADKACRDLLGDAGPQTMDPKQQQEMQDRALALSRCMREHGIDMPDPTFSGEGRVTMSLGGGIDPADPKFQEAQQACGSAFGPGAGKAITVGGAR
ncbi:MAG TPA: hypothetical protein VFS16_00390 [Acidimicrobiia bacterium]|nr:hypothetical protein [Acidimicrobiia bacterium]